MANTWQITSINLLREIIGDNGNTLTYSDQRLEQVLITSAHFLNQELDFDTDFTVDAEAITISPDPVAVQDYSFVNLMVLRSACILANAQKRLASNKALNITDGPSSINGKALFDAAKDYAKSICDEYNQAMTDFRMGRRIVGKAIVGPYRTDAVGFPTDRRDRLDYLT